MSNSVNKHRSDAPKKNTDISANRSKVKTGAVDDIVKDTKKNYFLVPVFIVLFLIPIMARFKVYDPKLREFPWFPDANQNIDFFLYYKQWTLVVVAGIMLVIAGIWIYSNRRTIKFNPIFIPLAVYALLSLISAIHSDYASYSFSGSYEQYESILAVLGYCIVVYYVFLFVKSERDLQLITYFLIAAAIVLSLIGLTQFLGHDFFTSETGLNLIVPEKYLSRLELSNILGKNRVYMSQFNPNYAGVFIAMVIPVILVMVFFQKKVITIVFSILSIIGLIVCLIGSRSLAGLSGLAVAGVCIIIFMWRYLFKRLYITIPFVLAVIIGFFILNNMTDQYFTNKIKNAMNIQKTEYALTKIETNDLCVSVTYKGNQLNAVYANNSESTAAFILYDENNVTVAGSYDEATKEYKISDERFAGITLGADTEFSNVFYIQIEGRHYRFTNQMGDNTYYYVNSMNRPDKIINAPSAVFTGYERFASGRGYIWSRTIPLLKDYVLLGSGPDTFTMVFPQQDYVNMVRYGYEGAVMTKPHSLYLQIAVQSGVLSLIAFLIFYAMYFVSSIRLYIRGRFTSLYAKVGLAVFIGTVAYMFTGLTNDSSITVAPVFWALMGVGIAVNHKVKPMILEEAAEFKKRKAEKKNVSKE
jgi:hypothetical protein